MRWLHGIFSNRTSLDGIRYGLQIVLDYDGFIAERALIRT